MHYYDILSENTYLPKMSTFEINFGYKGFKLKDLLEFLPQEKNTIEKYKEKWNSAH